MAKNNYLKIAMIGSKGLPFIYGGIERHVAEVSRRLAANGHKVTVYGRHPFSESGDFYGIDVRVVPALHTKNLETATNSFLSTVNAVFGGYNVIHFHGIGPSFFSILPILLGIPTVSTIHAPDYKQKKWGRVARFFLRLGEKIALNYCDASISVSKTMYSSFKERGFEKIHYIPNGTTIREAPEFKEAAKLGIEKERYVLAVGRFIVERNFHMLIEAFGELDTDVKLVIAGDVRFDPRYADRLKDMANDRVVFPGYVTGRLLDELYAHCMFFCLPSSLEGLSISLLEAMSFARPVVVSDIDVNREVAEGVGVFFRNGDKNDLIRALREVLQMGVEERERLGGIARKRVESEYNWDDITKRIEEIYLALL